MCACTHTRTHTHTPTYVSFCIYLYIRMYVHGSPNFQKDRGVFQGFPICPSTGVRSLCLKELVKDLLMKQKGHMQKIRAFLTARPSEPSGAREERMGRPASSHVLWTNCDIPQVFELVHGVRIGSRLRNLCFACGPDPLVLLHIEALKRYVNAYRYVCICIHISFIYIYTYVHIDMNIYMYIYILI